MHNGRAQSSCVLQSRNQRVSIIKVPDFVGTSWAGQRPGAVLGVLVDPSSRKSSPTTIYFPDSLKLPVKKIQAPTSQTSNSQSLVIASSASFSLQTAMLEGISTMQRTFLPDVLDPAYRRWLVSKPTQSPKGKASHKFSELSLASKTPVLLSAQATSALHQRMTDGSASSQGPQGSRLFRYFGSAEGSEMSTAASSAAATPSNWVAAGGSSADEDGPDARGGLRKKKRPAGGRLSVPEAQARLFKLFEERGDQGANLRDIIQHLGGNVPQSVVKQLLDTIAEPRKDRQGKRSLFVLKKEFSSSRGSRL